MITNVSPPPLSIIGDIGDDVSLLPRPPMCLRDIRDMFPPPSVTCWVMWRHDVTWPKLRGQRHKYLSEMWLGSKYAMRKICWLISLFERFQFSVLHRFSLEYLVIFRSSRQIFEFMINTFSIFMIWNHHCVTVSNSKMSVSMWRVEKHLTWTQTKNNDERSLFYDILWTNYYS